MPEGEVNGMRVVRIKELDACPIEVLKDETAECWGVVEVNNKLYKFDLKAYLQAAVDSNTGVQELKEKIAVLTEKVNSLLDGIDENIPIEG